MSRNSLCESIIRCELIGWAGMTGSRIIRRVSRPDTLMQNPTASAADTVGLHAAAFVQSGDDTDTVLLICRSDNGNWSMPGGPHEAGESLSDITVRKTREETGIHIHIIGLVGIFVTPGHVIRQTSNDEIGHKCTIVYRAEPVAGEPTPCSVSTQIEWVSIGAIADLPMGPRPARTHRLGINPARTPH
ncbi:NUDIX hydrolase [Nocardia sp. NPDC050630]|uniref:NUDIX hydrolase n=1 Tax=Nocardia sp. NPDC050630 TaxID=3364321 RepID=UPI003796BFD1